MEKTPFKVCSRNFVFFENALTICDASSRKNLILFHTTVSFTLFTLADSRSDSFHLYVVGIFLFNYWASLMRKMCLMSSSKGIDIWPEIVLHEMNPSNGILKLILNPTVYRSPFDP
ncbi:hypothetical protein T01_7252 [Trichinella spiralis]|uniref:Uncharacterized protein n=1 Tax=Trichinella spiralis TaxID=6334 RepID=A0A0V1B7S1_TRISP|nr:hypothetical protein T01_7252 [Trichinella spiralis]